MTRTNILAIFPESYHFASRKSRSVRLARRASSANVASLLPALAAFPDRCSCRHAACSGHLGRCRGPGRAYLCKLTLDERRQELPLR